MNMEISFAIFIIFYLITPKKRKFVNLMQVVGNWFVEFVLRSENFDLKNAPCSGRYIEVADNKKRRYKPFKKISFCKKAHENGR